MIYILQNLLPILVATLVGLVAGLAVQRLHPGRLGARQRVVAAIAQFWLCCIRVTSR
jgi:predicted Na+-dependent transporter